MDGAGDTRTAASDRRGHLPVNLLLAQVERAVTRQLEGVLADHGLSVDQWRVLDLLADGAGHPMSELATTVAVPGPTLTKIMDRLVDSALVYRRVDDHDRRRVLAFLSGTGRAGHRALAPAVAGAETEALAALGVDGTALVDLLDRLASRR